MFPTAFERNQRLFGSSGPRNMLVSDCELFRCLFLTECPTVVTHSQSPTTTTNLTLTNNHNTQKLIEAFAKVRLEIFNTSFQVIRRQQEPFLQQAPVRPKITLQTQTIATRIFQRPCLDPIASHFSSERVSNHFHLLRFLPAPYFLLSLHLPLSLSQLNIASNLPQRAVHGR